MQYGIVTWQPTTPKGRKPEDPKKHKGFLLDTGTNFVKVKDYTDGRVKKIRLDHILHVRNQKTQPRIKRKKIVWGKNF